MQRTSSRPLTLGHPIDGSVGVSARWGRLLPQTAVIAIANRPKWTHMDANRRKWTRRLRRPTAHRSLRLSAPNYLPQPPHTPRRPPPVTRRRLRVRWSSGRPSRHHALWSAARLVERLEMHAGVVLTKESGGDQDEQKMALKRVVGQSITATSPMPLSYYRQQLERS